MVLRVENLEKMADFYSKVLGLSEVVAPAVATRGYVWMAIGGGGYLILRRRREGEPASAGTAEVVLWTDDTKQWADYLVSQGLGVMKTHSAEAGLPLDLTGVTGPEGNTVWVSKRPQMT